MTAKRVLIVQYSIAPPGGSSGVGAWMIEALKDRHRVALLAWARPDVALVNRFFGTTLAAGDFACHVPPASGRRLFAASPLPLALLRDLWLIRIARRLAPDFDVVISASNEADVGPRGIQYVHYPRLDPQRPAVDLRWFHRWAALTRTYRSAAVRLSGFSMQRMRANVTLANSAWTAARVRAVHGIEVRVVHPALAAPAAVPAWPQRADGFVCISRLAPEKRIEWVIDIVERVRRAGHRLPLHIVGSDGTTAYADSLRRQLAARADWVTLDEDLPRPRLEALIRQYRYGIHAMEEEHFGMAVAEMVSAGCIVFAPGGGGPREILAQDERLLYRTPAEAVDKIVAVLRDEVRQRDLRERLAAGAAAFSPERFTDAIRAVVDDFPAR